MILFLLSRRAWLRPGAHHSCWCCLPGCATEFLCLCWVFVWAERSERGGEETAAVSGPDIKRARATFFILQLLLRTAVSEAPFRQRKTSQLHPQYCDVSPTAARGDYLSVSRAMLRSLGAKSFQCKLSARNVHLFIHWSIHSSVYPYTHLSSIHLLDLIRLNFIDLKSLSWEFNFPFVHPSIIYQSSVHQCNLPSIHPSSIHPSMKSRREVL